MLLQREVEQERPGGEDGVQPAGVLEGALDGDGDAVDGQRIGMGGQGREPVGGMEHGLGFGFDLRVAGGVEPGGEAVVDGEVDGVVGVGVGRLGGDGEEEVADLGGCADDVLRLRRARAEDGDEEVGMAAAACGDELLLRFVRHRRSCLCVEEIGGAEAKRDFRPQRSPEAADRQGDYVTYERQRVFLDGFEVWRSSSLVVGFPVGFHSLVQFLGPWWSG